MSSIQSQCPYHQADSKQGQNQPIKPKAMTIRDWWPNSLDLRILHQDPLNARPSHVPHPFASSVAANNHHNYHYTSYAEKFSQVDLHALRNEIHQALTTSHPAWPADYGHYGPLMVRLAWHAAGTYRVFDGRGGANSGNIRLAPLNSWPDNANLDKIRRFILWPIKQRYGQSISWADLIILAGNVALESMMINGRWDEAEPLWYSGGRIDAFAPEEDVFWGLEGAWLQDQRHTEEDLEEKKLEESTETGLRKPFGATQMGLIYVNPEGPGGNPDILASARDIRITFSRMGMSDTETVALIAGGHTFGKAHGAADPSEHVGPEPEGAPVEDIGLGWKNSFKSGKGADTITSGLEGAWTANPTVWDNGYFHNLFNYEWTQSKSPGGAIQWVPSEESIVANGGKEAVATVPDAHHIGVKHVPIMFTTDLAMRYDPIYGPISKKFHLNPDEFKDAFKRAWYKLCHRDSGPKSRHLGKLVPNEDFMWLDPIPSVSYRIINQDDVVELKKLILDLIQSSKLSISDLVKAAWGAASTYRCTDHRGGANGGRIRLLPQREWAVNDPPSLNKVILHLGNIQHGFNQSSNNHVSFSDLIVLAGNVAIEEAARRSGYGDIQVPFVPGRVDASQSETDVNSFKVLEPTVDGFRNYDLSNKGLHALLPEQSLIDRAHLLTLTAPEMVVLIGGLRVLKANADHESLVGILTHEPEVLNNSYFLNLLDINTTWEAMGDDGKLFKGATTIGKNWVASRVDLILASNSQLRAISEAYACVDSCEHFLRDFIYAWNKIMMLDRFDLIPKDGTSKAISRL